MFDVTLIHRAMEKFLERQGVGRGRIWKVRGYKEEWESVGYCDTCADREFTVRIYYEDIADDNHEYVFEGDLSTLIRMLTEDD